MGMNVSAIAADQRAYEAQNQRKIENEEESWFGHQLRNIGMTDTADWLEDKDKVCTDGQDDGHLSFIDGAKSFAKGLFGGLPKAIINHPISSLVFAGAGAAALAVTGGAAAPILWGLGAVATTAMGGLSIYNYAKAQTDGEAKAALEGMGTATQATIMLDATYNSTMAAAKNAGVNTDGNILQTMKSAGKISWRNMKANYKYFTEGVITQGSNMTTRNYETSLQADGKALKAYKIDLSGESVEANLAKNPGLAYDAKTQQYYVPTSWGGSYIDPNAPKGYMFLEYGPGDCNAVEGEEFFETYINFAKYSQNGAKSYVDPSTLEGGQQLDVTKYAQGRFKVVPEGTGYIGKETKPGVIDPVQPKSVLRIDNQGRPYQSTVEFMFKKFKDLTPEQIQILKSVDPEAAAKYGH